MSSLYESALDSLIQQYATDAKIYVRISLDKNKSHYFYSLVFDPILKALVKSKHVPTYYFGESSKEPQFWNHPVNRNINSFTAVVFQKKIYIIGGFNFITGNAVNSVYIQDDTHKWIEGPPLIYNTSYPQVISQGDRLFVLGDKLQILYSHTWIDKGKMPRELFQHYRVLSSVLFNNQLFIFICLHPNICVYICVFIYHILTNTWSPQIKLDYIPGCYVKEIKSVYKARISYQRCRALTQSGQQCKHECVGTHCWIHNKKRKK